MMRTVIAHVHLFKNAGTSVEHSLHDHFGKRWASFDEDTAGSLVGAERLIDFLDAHPTVVAVSSHQIRPPLRPTESYTFLPLVYLRHPIDRIRSAYDFERNQGSVSPSSRAAASLDFGSWIQFHHNKNSTQCRNFQTYALTSVRNDTGGPLIKRPDSEHLESAKAFLSSLPAFGLVETFESSWQQIVVALQAHFPDFDAGPTRANVRSGAQGRLDERLRSVEKELKAADFRELVEANAADIALYDWAQRHLGVVL